MVQLVRKRQLVTPYFLLRLMSALFIDGDWGCITVNNAGIFLIVRRSAFPDIFGVCLLTWLIWTVLLINVDVLVVGLAL